MRMFFWPYAVSCGRLFFFFFFLYFCFMFIFNLCPFLATMSFAGDDFLSLLFFSEYAMFLV